MKFEKELVETRDKMVKSSNYNSIGSAKKNMPVFPRYVRVNKLKATTEEVVKLLKETNNQPLSEKSKGENDENTNNKNNHNFDIYQDAHIPDLLVIPPKTSIQWHESELVTAGKVILQDKSSCFSALALVHGSEKLIKGVESNGDGKSNDNVGDYIDATAAPGNKTLHLAALIYDDIMKRSAGEQPRTTKKNNNKKRNKNKDVKVFAFDRSSARISILKNRVTDLAPSVLLNDDEIKNKHNKKITKREGINSSFPVDICPIHQDFLKVDPNDTKYKNVKSILLDPSCSGSGIVNSPDRIVDATANNSNTKDDGETKRIESLSNFQLVALKHAMSFPQCERIVYSTCSIHQRENEDVVAAAMNETNETLMADDGDDDGMKWELVSPLALKHWKRRGFEVDDLTKEQSDCLIRVNGMDGDDTNGFFVSLFERKKVKSQYKADQQQQPLDLISDTTGVKGIYNGQFSIVPTDESMKGTGQEPKLSNLDNKDKANDNENEKDLSTKEQKVQVPTAKSEKELKPRPKKVAKKLKWKQRQKELKLARLKKKKDALNQA